MGYRFKILKILGGDLFALLKLTKLLVENGYVILFRVGYIYRHLILFRTI